MPALVDDGPGRVDLALVVAEADGQHRDPGHKGAGPEAQHAAPIPTGPLWCHHQHGKPPVFCPSIQH